MKLYRCTVTTCMVSMHVCWLQCMHGQTVFKPFTHTQVVGLNYVSLILGTFTTNPYGENGTVPYWLCTAQAAFSVFGTESSILWTIAVAVYLFVIAFSSWPTVAKLLVPVLHVACWGIPFIITVSLGAKQLLGKLCSCPALSVFAEFTF